MGGGPLAALGVSLDNMALQQAASNVQQNLSNQTSAAKSEWEQEYDRKEREVDEMIERQRQERERVWNEENDSETDA